MANEFHAKKGLFIDPLAGNNQQILITDQDGKVLNSGTTVVDISGFVSFQALDQKIDLNVNDLFVIEDSEDSYNKKYFAFADLLDEQFVSVPISASSTGLRGQLAYDAVNEILYTAIDDNSWVREPVSSNDFSANIFVSSMDYRITPLAATGDEIVTVDASGTLQNSGSTLSDFASSATIPSITQSVSATFQLTSTDAGKVFYASDSGTIVLNQSPVNGEHLWIKNKSSQSITLSGGLYNIEETATNILPQKSSVHVHFDGTEWWAI